MATNQMEEACISRQRNKVLGAIIERYPDSNLCVEGDECVLQVTGEGLTDYKQLDAKHFGADWDELMQTVVDFSYYNCHLPDYGYHWIDKQFRRDWFLSYKK
ncbi:MAG: hypothetical protein HXO58_08070 [Rothia mucilaginosa]|uniref:Uncharacterized protein n=1 Tax=Rothia mucilaginosa TaxID=43675 RepID=A0A930PRS5_9MICC|nr:hypothetical protein [Rothia mucilaginosa]MBF1659774.1 hypothetical protein [Rothia mucilaginosa]